MSPMTRVIADEVFLVVRAARYGQLFEVGSGVPHVLIGDPGRPVRVEAGPRWQPLGLLPDEDATWEDAEWQ